MNIQRGEIIRINLNPTQGRERGLETADSKAGGTLQRSGEARPCLVLSHTKYNLKRGGIVVVTPITSTLKPQVRMMIAIPNGFKTKGSVIAEQIRTLNLKTRWWKTTGEVLPTKFVDRVVETFKLIVG